MGDLPRVPSLSAEVALAAGATLGESPLWDTDASALHWVDIVAGTVHRFLPRSGRDESFEAGCPVGSLGLRTDGGLVIALAAGFATADVGGRGLRAVPDFSVDTSLVRFNDGKVDPWGGFCAGTMHLHGRQAYGALYRLHPDLSVSELVSQVVCSNGLDWSDDRRSLYYIDTPTQAVDRFALDPETGELRGRQRIFCLAAPGRPDGMTIDAEGCLWVALWGGGEVRRYTPDGRLDRSITLPVSLVTSLTFGGEHLDELYLTTASKNLSEEAREAEPHAGDLFWCLPGVQGRPPGRFGASRRAMTGVIGPSAY